MRGRCQGKGLNITLRALFAREARAEALSNKNTPKFTLTRCQDRTIRITPFWFQKFIQRSKSSIRAVRDAEQRETGVEPNPKYDIAHQLVTLDSWDAPDGN